MKGPPPPSAKALQAACNGASWEKESFDFLRYVENAIYLSPRTVLRFTNAQKKSEDTLKGEILWLNSLHENGLRVVRILSNAQGSSLQYINDGEQQWYLCAFQRLQGEFVGPEHLSAPKVIRAWAQSLALLHQHAEVPHSTASLRPRGIDESGLIEALGARKHSALGKKFLEHYDDVQRELAQADTLIHADLHPGNFVLDGDHHAWVFDFDDSQRAAISYDLGTSLFSLSHMIRDAGQDPAVAISLFKNFYLHNSSDIEKSKRDWERAIEITTYRALLLYHWSIARSQSGAFDAAGLRWADKTQASIFERLSKNETWL